MAKGQTLGVDSEYRVDPAHAFLFVTRCAHPADVSVGDFVFAWTAQDPRTPIYGVKLRVMGMIIAHGDDLRPVMRHRKAQSVGVRIGNQRDVVALDPER